MSDEVKIWTFGGMYDKVREDADLDEDDPEEQFVSFSEMVGYFNEGLEAAESEVSNLDKDYFLTIDYLPSVAGQSEYDLPSNISADKIRGLVYSNGSVIYPIKRFRRLNKFEEIAFAKQYNSAEEYRYYLVNRGPRDKKMVFVPPIRETSILPPASGSFTPIERWYIRNANKVPYVGDYVGKEDLLPEDVNITDDELTVAPEVPYVTGDKLKFSVVGVNVLPAGLTAGTVYYAIRVSDTRIKLASSLALARAGTAIDLTDQGSGFFSMKVAATEAIIRATVMDIPEAAVFIMEWVKANCLFKDGDPRLAGTVAKLENQRTMLVDTLKDRVPDDDNQVEADYSFYTEMS